MPPIEPSSSAETPGVVPPSPPQPDAADSPGSDSVPVIPSKPRGAARASRTRQPQSRSPLTSLLLILGVAGGFCFFAMGLHHCLRMARTYVAQQDRYRIPLRQIEITPLPLWIRGDLLAEVQQLAGLPDMLNTLDENLSQEVHNAFAL